MAGREHVCVVGTVTLLLLLGTVSALDDTYDPGDIEMVSFEKQPQGHPSVQRGLTLGDRDNGNSNSGEFMRSMSSPDIRAGSGFDGVKVEDSPSVFDILAERHMEGTGTSSIVVRGGLGEPGGSAGDDAANLRIKTVSWNLNHKLPSISDVKELVGEAASEEYEVIVIGYQECMDGCLPPWTEEQREALRGTCEGEELALASDEHMTQDYDMLSCLHHKVLTGKYFRVAHSQLGCCKDMGMLAKRYHGYARVEVWVHGNSIDIPSLRDFIRDKATQVDLPPTFDAMRRPMHMAKWVSTADIALEIEEVSSDRSDSAWESRFSYIPAKEGFHKVSKSATAAMVKFRPNMAPLCFVNAHFPSTRMGENVETKSLRARNEAARQVQRDILLKAFEGKCGFVVFMGDLNYRLDFRSVDEFKLSYLERCIGESPENHNSLLKLREAVLDDVKDTMVMNAESDDDSSSTSSGASSDLLLRPADSNYNPMMELFKWHDELQLMFHGMPSTPPRPPPRGCVAKTFKGGLMNSLVGLVASKNTKQRQFLGVEPNDMQGLKPFDGQFRLVPVSQRCPPTFCKNTMRACALAIKSGYSEGLDQCYQGPGMSALAHGHVLPAWTDRVLYKGLANMGVVVKDGAVMECPIGSIEEPTSGEEVPDATLSVSDHTPVTVDFEITVKPITSGSGKSREAAAGSGEASGASYDNERVGSIVDDAEDIE